MAASKPEQVPLPSIGREVGDGTVVINDRCRVETRHGYRVVTVCGVVVASYACGDRMSEAHAIVNLVEQGFAKQSAVAIAFGCDERTVRRNQRRFESGGLVALGRPVGYPKGVARVPRSRVALVNDWKAEGVGHREIARRLGVSAKAARNLIRRLGWESPVAEQGALGFGAGDPNLSGSSATPTPNTPSSPPEPTESGPEHLPEGGDPNLSGSSATPAPKTPALPPEPAESGPECFAEGGDPNLSGCSDEPSLPTSLDRDPADRCLDRVLACLGMLDDAAPLFRSGTKVPSAGALLAIPALVDSGVFECAAEIYGSIGPAFYGLRTTVAMLLLMALMRIKRPEALKEHSPQALGRLLGLDRAPEVKTLRRKLARLATYGRAAELGRALAQRRVAARGHAMGFLYVDGHVRAYHGKRRIPKAHLARMRLSMPATTDYWVNDAEGEPLFVVTTEANRALAEMLPVILEEVRALVGERRVTVVFDRGGWSPKLFRQLIESGFDILTYRKKRPGGSRSLPRSCFTVHEAELDGRKVSYDLADRGTYIDYGPRSSRKRLHLREVTRLGDDGHQTPIVTSRSDLPAIEIAHRMFERWRQENFFKYLREEYALDALVDYGVEPADATRQVPNPRRKALHAEVRAAYAELNALAVALGVEAFIDVAGARRTLRAFKNDNAPIMHQIRAAADRITALEKQRDATPSRVPVQQLARGEVIKLRVERKLITDLLKMVAYQAEGDLLRLIAPHYKRAEDEGRTLVQSALATAGDIVVGDDELHVYLEPLSAPRRTQALLELCDQLNGTATRFPGSALRLRFSVKPAPDTTLAFPGPRTARPAER
ncbi:MAG: transposase [Sandaracinaceae bacterium]|nr:transposase [Sandaracinaceae bacterium]